MVLNLPAFSSPRNYSSAHTLMGMSPAIFGKAKHNKHLFHRKNIFSVFECFVGSMEALLKAFLLFFLLPDWLKLNHLKS